MVVLARGRVFDQSKERSEVRWREQRLLGARLWVWYLVIVVIIFGMLLLIRFVLGRVVEMLECRRPW
jgi:uncharacterized membrane protein